MANPSQYYDIIEKPLVTEKSTVLQDIRNQYAFRVQTHANSYLKTQAGLIRSHFVLTAANPNDPLDDDYGLIDFGAHTATPTMYGMPVVGMASINTRNAICHDGIRTGIACGQLGDRLIGPQYLTTGMPDSIPGDSGGPVWQVSATGAVIVGIWLGEHIDSGGTHYGRFISLADIADQIGKTHFVV